MIPLFDCHRPNLHVASLDLFVWLKVGDDQGSSLGLRSAVSWDLVFDTEAPPSKEGGAWGFGFVCTEVHWSWTWSETATRCRSCHIHVETVQLKRRTKELNGDEGCARPTVKEHLALDVIADPWRLQGVVEACLLESVEA